MGIISNSGTILQSHAQTCRADQRHTIHVLLVQIYNTCCRLAQENRCCVDAVTFYRGCDCKWWSQAGLAWCWVGFGRPVLCISVITRLEWMWIAVLKSSYWQCLQKVNFNYTRRNLSLIFKTYLYVHTHNSLHCVVCREVYARGWEIIKTSYGGIGGRLTHRVALTFDFPDSSNGKLNRNLIVHFDWEGY